MNRYFFCIAPLGYGYSRLLLWMSLIILMGPAVRNVSGEMLAPPPEPAVKPIVSAPVDVDTDNSKVDDRLESVVAQARATLARIDATTDEIQTSLKDLTDEVLIELIFSEQVTQEQIDTFLECGGTIDHIFTHVSYGWTGKISLKDTVSLPGLMGLSLLGVVARKEIELHMDEAGQCGRVRPTVWDAGYSGSDSITIAIIDTGVDGSHTDLNGREEYWKDWTSDNHLASQDMGHHGSHVAGIATGTGAAAGVDPADISFMNLGNFPSSAGSFYISPFHVPTTVTPINWASDMRWATVAGVTAQIGHLNSDAGGSWALVTGSTKGTTSPLAETNNGVSNPPGGRTNRWNSYPSKSFGIGTQEYAVENTVTYDGVGDGYNLFRGIAPGCMWAGLKVFEDDGSGSSTDIGEALDDIVAQREAHLIKVANMSLGITGDPGINTSTRNKTNTAASNGIVTVISAGNDGDNGAGGVGEIDDPSRAHYAITVAASSDTNQLTDYSSHGFDSPGDANIGDQDRKPDIVAPGGSSSESYIMSVDSNTGDSKDNTGANFIDATNNNYYNIKGTSMAAPFIAGCSALVIDALQQAGETWDFTGAGALSDVLRVKMLLLMTATETNMDRESGPSGNPTLDRGSKDINEGYGLVNADAAVDAGNGTSYSGGGESDTFGSAAFDKRCWARAVSLVSSQQVDLTLAVPGSGDFDMYLYSGTPDTYGNPQILASSTNSGLDTDESISFTPSSTENGYLVVKRAAGSGTWNLTGIWNPTTTTTVQIIPSTIPTTVQTTSSTITTTVGSSTTTTPFAPTTTVKTTSSIPSTSSSSTTTSRKLLWPMAYDEMWGSKKYEKLLILRVFRDEILLNTEVGREYVFMLYDNSFEIATLLLQESSLTVQTREVIDELLMKVESLLYNDEIEISQDTIDNFVSLLDNFESNASPELRTVIRELKRDIYKREIFEQFEVIISE